MKTVFEEVMDAVRVLFGLLCLVFIFGAASRAYSVHKGNFATGYDTVGCQTLSQHTCALTRAQEINSMWGSALMAAVCLVFVLLTFIPGMVRRRLARSA